MNKNKNYPAIPDTLLNLVHLLENPSYNIIFCAMLRLGRTFTASEIARQTNYARSTVKSKLRKFRDFYIIKDVGLHPVTGERVYELSDIIVGIKKELYMTYCEKTEYEEKGQPTKNQEHEEIASILVKLGKNLGYEVKQEYPDPQNLYRYDVVWFKPPSLVPLKIFEIIIKGDIDKALLRLKHASDIWGAGPELFLIVKDETQKRRAESLLWGAFHELRNKVYIVNELLLREIVKDSKLINLIKTIIC